MTTITTDLITTAARFVNSTSSHIFLTGKAGTGKTTFLRKLAEETHKKFVIVAPTGIAALNAGGVTIHSQFLLPLGTFLPDRTPSGDFKSDANIYTQFTLSRKHPLNSIRKQVLREIDLLVIDEVSMLRADVLDAIDYRMRAVKGRFDKSFGGVQVLMIGDLYQLPPIVREHEWNYLKRYYHSIHFFEAKALQSDGFVFIELDKIFRQSDNRFIDVLNNLRDNVIKAEDIELLNAHYKTIEEIRQEKEIITLTTHNVKADEMNRNSLNALTSPSYFFYAAVAEDFPESLYPLPEKMELKVGARVMFVKNDSSEEKAYFNGKIATVTEVDNDRIIVIMDGQTKPYSVRKERWENKKYTVDTSTRELDEEIVGTFDQYPLKLAWAITVHKSQGLTFEKAIIDVGNAFAPGQVYVALSRLKSLDGLILRTRINTAAISSDDQVIEFSRRKNMQGELTDVLKKKQNEFVQQLLAQIFDFSGIEKDLAHVSSEKNTESSLAEELKPVLIQILLAFNHEQNNTAKFKHQLLYLFQEKEHEQLLDRLNKGSVYYINLIKEQSKKLLVHINEVQQLKKQKGYLTTLGEIDQLLCKRLEQIEKSVLLVDGILGGTADIKLNNFKSSFTKEREAILREAAAIPARSSAEIRKLITKKKSNKPDTLQETVRLIKDGNSMADTAKLRGITVGTIENHVARAVEEGFLPVEQFVEPAELSSISSVMGDKELKTMTEIYEKFNGQHSYGKLRIVQAWMKLNDTV